jgi:long-chain acyl-CoA synthetase
MWSNRVVRGQVNGHPSLMYADRPTSVGSVVGESTRWSDREYLVHGQTRLKFGQHARTVTGASRRLLAAGIRAGDRVGVFAANSPDWVTTFFSILRIGAIAVPFNGWWVEREVREGLCLVSPRVVVADSRRAERLPIGVKTLDIADLACPEAIPEDAHPAREECGPEPAENDPAVILFTAGTTATPKAAVLSHRALIANLQTLLIVARKLPHEIPDTIHPTVTLVGLPLFHIGAIQLILVPLVTGGKIVFLEGRFDAELVLRVMEAEEVTMFSGVPTMMERLLRHPDRPQRDLSSLRTIVLGGSPVGRDLLARVAEALPQTQRHLGETYGLTEAGGVVSTGVGPELERKGSSGRIAPVVEVRIENPSRDGEGEVLIRSPAAMDGYWNVTDDGTIDPDGWIRTGDVGHTDEDRHLYITGRVKDIIVRGGENVSAVAVESVIHNHPDVREVAVVGLPDSYLGELVAAAVTVERAGVVSVPELIEWSRRELAAFEVPSRWWIRTAALPTNDAGKVLKRELVREWPDVATAEGN